MYRVKKYPDFLHDFSQKLILQIVLIVGLASVTTALFNSLNWFKSEDNSTNVWERWKDENGRPFYINHGVRKAQVEAPREINPKAPLKVNKIPYPKTLQDKMELFHQQMDKPENPQKFIFEINRSNILEDSYKVVMEPEGVSGMKATLKVRFAGEETIHEHGKEPFAKEWLSLLCEEISDPENGYFRYADGHNYESEINPESDAGYFKFIGRVVGTAVHHQILVDVSFVKPYYKTMLRKPIEMGDVKVGDPTYYNYLLRTKKKDLKDYLSLISPSEDLGNESESQLRMMAVHHKYVTSIRDHMSAFLEGFADLIPLHLLRIFTADELKLVIAGTQTIDVDDWRYNTNHEIPKDSTVVRWFWKIVKEFDNDDRRRLLQFVTGTSRVPVKGFKNLNPAFKIGRDYTRLREVDRYPTAQLCSNMIILSDYSSKKVMKERIMTVLHEENQVILLE